MQKNIDDNNPQKQNVVNAGRMLRDSFRLSLLIEVIAAIKNKENFTERPSFVILLCALALGILISLIINAKIVQQESLQWTRRILIAVVTIKIFVMYMWLSGINSVDVLMRSWTFWISQALWFFFSVVLLSAYSQLKLKKT